MGLLDCFDLSLPDGAAAFPLTIHREKRTVGQFVVFVCTMVGSVVGPYRFYKMATENPSWEWLGDFVPLLLCVWGTWLSTLFLDMVIVNPDAARANIRSCRANGFSPLHIFLSMAFIIVFAEPVVLILLMGHDGAMPTAHWDLTALWHMVATIVVAEFCFTSVHRWMHRKAPEIHRFHHCVFIPTYASNFFLDPPDFFIEFGTPLIVAYLMLRTDICGMKDPFAYLLVVWFVHTFYEVDHCRFLKLPHYGHHTHINSNYTAYSKTAGKRDQLEATRKIIKHPSLVEQRQGLP